LDGIAVQDYAFLAFNEFHNYSTFQQHDHIFVMLAADFEPWGMIRHPAGGVAGVALRDHHLTVPGSMAQGGSATCWEEKATHASRSSCSAHLGAPRHAFGSSNSSRFELTLRGLERARLRHAPPLEPLLGSRSRARREMSRPMIGRSGGATTAGPR